ncbi:MAG: DUF924 family protein [Alphaproteobacteria bacterium]|nr:DUF924 family protein [Alphaproteobacteria bacterium]
MATKKGPQAQVDEAKRKAAQAAALRENLKRRKLQARGRAAAEDEAAIAAILEFWFSGGDPAKDGFRALWFEKDDAFDGECRSRFAGLAAQAAAGELDRWGQTAEGGLALLVLLDQIPRNIHRGTPQAFASDPTALSLARRMVARGFDRELPMPHRLFAYLPFTHAEDIAAQDECVRLVSSLPETAWRAQAVKSAVAHRDVIAKFGRFPHRNAALGRDSTQAEREYLAQPGAGF